MNKFVSGWYLIYTRPLREKKVADQLLNENIEAYLPTIRTLRQWKDRKKIIEVPLFPSYIFVFLQKLQHYYAGLNVDGALSYVKFGKHVARVEDKLVDDLRMMVDGGANLEVVQESFQPRQTLIIKEGPLSGLSCEMVKHKGQEKILVRVNLLNRFILADLPASHLMNA